MRFLPPSKKKGPASSYRFGLSSGLELVYVPHSYAWRAMPEGFSMASGGIQGWGRPHLPGWKKRTRNGWLLGSRSLQQDRMTDSDDEWCSRSGSSRRRSVSTALIITHRLLRRLRLNLESLLQHPAPSSSFKATPVWPGHRASGRILLDQPVPLKQLAICQASDDDVGMLDTQSIFARSPQQPPRFSQFFAFRVGVPRSEAMLCHKP